MTEDHKKFAKQRSDLDTKLSNLTAMFFSYQLTMIKYLEEK